MATILGPIGELVAHAHAYAEAGLEVFPLRADKAPGTANGFYDATTDHDQIERWWHDRPGALIGHRIDARQIIFDIDPRHGGHDTWKALKAELGAPLPVTRAHASGRGDGGGHLWWIRPDDKLSMRRLTDWARERGVGQATEGGSWQSGIDLLHHDLRYTVLPPSPHPFSGKPYTWLPERDLTVLPAPLPAYIADLIVDQAPPPAPRIAQPNDPDSIADWYSSRADWRDLLGQAGWQLVAGDGNTDGSRWRHPSATSSCSATIRYRCLFVYSTSTAFEVTEPGNVHGYTPFKAYALLRHGGDESTAARAAREQKDGPIRLDSRSLEHLLGPSTAVGGAQGPPAPPEPGIAAVSEPLPPLQLPDVVWDSREALTHIRDAARARLVAPDAVLGAVLARVAAITPHIVELPSPVGSPVGLTYYCAIVGPPSIGKSAAVNIAAELVPAPSSIQDLVPIGSGEGITEILYGLIPDLNGGKQKVRAVVHHAAIFHIDEGQVLGDLSARTGSTLMPTLRSAWTNGKLGAANASADRRRIVDGSLYVYGITLGVQPEMAGALLGDIAGGTPQRFLWLSAVDPQMAAGTPWPGPLNWQAPEMADLEDLKVTRRGWRRARLPVDPKIESDIIVERERIGRGGAVEPGDEHRMLLRFKTAALLGLLDNRLEVNVEDWVLADLILDTSKAVRRSVEATLSAVATRGEQAATLRRVRQELGVEGAREARALDSAARSIARWVIKDAAAEAHFVQGGGCTRRCLSAAIGSRRKEFVTVDEAVDEAVRMEWIVPFEDRWLPGSSRPA